jgi:hypothetical protein
MLPKLAGRYSTGAASARDTADLQMHSLPAFWLTHAAGGPLDAPEVIPAGSCNSTDVRAGPWHLNDGMGRYVPAATHYQR